MKTYNLTVKTDHPVAYESPDHIMPWGTKRDNSTNLDFIREVLQEYLEHFLDVKNNPNVLDLGCSGGQMVMDFVNHHCLAVGLEGSDYSVVHQRANWPEYYNKHLFTADVTKPYSVYNRDERVYFDLITAWELVEHIAPTDIEVLLEQISDNLKPGGKFIASVSTRPDVIEGVVLHQSVFPKEQWLNTILPPLCEKYNLEIHEYPYKHKVRQDGGSFHIMLKKK